MKEEGRFAVLFYEITKQNKIIKKKEQVSEANGKRSEFHACKKVDEKILRKEVAMLLSVFNSLTY